jgi:uncharacterized protein YqjF (DUF2071 family)
MSEWVLRQLLERQLPSPRVPLMIQYWTQLLFLHWRWAAAEIQKRLPGGLVVDTFDGTGWIGLVPFFMKGVRPSGFPALPLVSNFLELNLRTYVKDGAGRPGIWFFSLDANQPLAVWTARMFFALPYRHATMHASHRDGWTEYASARVGGGPMLEYRYRGVGPLQEAVFGSLEFFLVERYRLFASRRGQLLSGRVYHPPYQLSGAEVSHCDTRLFRLDDLESPSRPPDHVCYAPGLGVSVYALELGGASAETF